MTARSHSRTRAKLKRKIALARVTPRSAPPRKRKKVRTPAQADVVLDCGYVR